MKESNGGVPGDGELAGRAGSAKRRQQRKGFQWEQYEDIAGQLLGLSVQIELAIGAK
jgi:hypothetical protein